jgi:chromosomal replication initiation ATPase DnaA
MNTEETLKQIEQHRKEIIRLRLTIKKAVPKIHLKILIASIEKDLGFEKGQLLKASRKHNIKYYRYSIMHIFHKFENATYKEIGKQFSRDHSTVINANTKIKNAIDVKDDEVLEILTEVENSYYRAMNDMIEGD